jgi:hypothetical protein
VGRDEGDYSKVKVLRDLLKISGRTTITVFHVSICPIGVTMLLLFPTAKAQYFRQHFGATEIRQSIVRHTFVAGPETGGIEEVAHLDEQQSTALPANLLQLSDRVCPLEDAGNVPTFRIVQRLKLGRSNSDAPDPLSNHS